VEKAGSDAERRCKLALMAGYEGIRFGIQGQRRSLEAQGRDKFRRECLLIR